MGQGQREDEHEHEKRGGGGRRHPRRDDLPAGRHERNADAQGSGGEEAVGHLARGAPQDDRRAHEADTEPDEGLGGVS